jgi:hypothetical protein
VKNRAIFRKISFFVLLTMGSCNGEKHVAADSASSRAKILQKKYSAILGVNENAITNIALYNFIDEWYSVPYKSAGKTKAGVDCSGFVSLLYAQVYKKTISGPSTSIFDECSMVAEKNLEEGDLVFFKINSDKVSHIGVYLQNRHFVHASVHNGVIISSLDEAYYKKYFFKGGKLKS